MLYKHFQTNDSSQPEILIWKTTESVEEMLSMFPEEISAQYGKEIEKFKHSKRKLEFLCARYLLRLVLDDEHYVLYEDSGRPYISTGKREMNISHTKDYVAIATHRNRRVALDIETRGTKVERVIRKFLTEKEINWLAEEKEERLLQLHILWCAKETLYKIMTYSDIEFNEHLHVEEIKNLSKEGIINCFETRTNERKRYTLHYRVFQDFVLVYGITN